MARRHPHCRRPQRGPQSALRFSSGARKPNSVQTVIPLGASLLARSSDLPGDLGASSRNARGLAATLSPYLVLLRVGFTMQRALLRARCALTAPFHPYLTHPDGRIGRYVLCGTGRPRPLTAESRALPGTPLCGVRTFLVLRLAPEAATVRPRCWIYFRPLSEKVTGAKP
jgi:hypothetical protein